MSYLELFNAKTHGVKLEQNETYFNIKVRQLCLKLLKQNPKQIIGYKIYKSHIIIATNCKFDKNYDDYNYEEYFAFYDYNSHPPFMENKEQIKALNNDNLIVKKTVSSNIYYLNF